MDLPIFYCDTNEAVEITPVTFYNLAGTIADPSSVSCVVYDPSGTPTTYTFASGSGIGQITQVATGDYALAIDGLTVPGLYMFTWIGTGNNVQQVTPGRFRLTPLTAVTSSMQNWYCSLEEFKSRNGILVTNTDDDYEITLAIQAASGWINRYCGTHFYQVQEARTYPVTDIYTMPIDQMVPGSITAFQLDYDGDGVFEVSWTEGTNYQVLREGETYNKNYAGINRPFDFVRVLLGTPVSVGGGQFFPFVWPFTHNDRVKITCTWGWDQVPEEVSHACLIMATQLFKEKDSPWGTVGYGDVGTIRTSQSPFLIELLRPYINPRKKVGV